MQHLDKKLARWVKPWGSPAFPTIKCEQICKNWNAVKEAVISYLDSKICESLNLLLYNNQSWMREMQISVAGLDSKSGWIWFPHPVSKIPICFVQCSSLSSHTEWHSYLFWFCFSPGLSVSCSPSVPQSILSLCIVASTLELTLDFFFILLPERSSENCSTVLPVGGGISQWMWYVWNVLFPWSNPS